mmetsp:Transcript_40585/g.65851  ORF Transcript_40585/g.65851 Transcript_40585/m.65851 type:complete len:252 (-) Transcript_40585:167-922(-)
MSSKENSVKACAFALNQIVAWHASSSLILFHTSCFTTRPYAVRQNSGFTARQRHFRSKSLPNNGDSVRRFERCISYASIHRDDLLKVCKEIKVADMLLPTYERNIIDLIDQVAPENPTVSPSTSDLLRGTWRLIYTTEGPLAGLMAGGLFGMPVKNVMQTVRGGMNTEGGTIENIVNFANSAELVVAVSFSVESSDTLKFIFKSTKFTNGWFSLRIPFALGRGTLTTVYLDETCRVQKDSTGWISVFKRVP